LSRRSFTRRWKLQRRQINSQLSTRSSLRELLNYFFKLAAKHIHLPGHQIAAQRDAYHAEVARVRNEVGPAAP
jgi:hypothetical protein